ncbi:MAG: hypothetical protein FWF23_03615 [Alphaproteobacteria bacterium]|nr:hypothetical protein [Alphaproteobacteria bacterium]MCL2505842.1 hypothetical protein [Alphaproteobacteria bacterium]
MQIKSILLGAAFISAALTGAQPARAAVIYSVNDYPYYPECENEIASYCADIDGDLSTCMKGYIDRFAGPCYTAFVDFGGGFWGDDWFEEHRRDGRYRGGDFDRHRADNEHMERFEGRPEEHFSGGEHMGGGHFGGGMGGGHMGGGGRR